MPMPRRPGGGPDPVFQGILRGHVAGLADAWAEQPVWTTSHVVLDQLGDRKLWRLSWQILGLLQPARPTTPRIRPEMMACSAGDRSPGTGALHVLDILVGESGTMLA